MITSNKDRNILRELGSQVAEIAALPRTAEDHISVESTE